MKMLCCTARLVRLCPSSIERRRFWVLRESVDARVGVAVVGSRGINRKEKAYENRKHLKSLCSSTSEGREGGAGTVRYGGLEKGLRARKASTRRRTRKMSMTEGTREVAQSGFVAPDGGSGEGVNVGGGASLPQAGGAACSSVVVDHGFSRPEMYSESLVGTVAHYERHVFLCYKEPESWPARVEAADFDRLPRFFVAALRARKNDMPKKTRLTICEGRDGTESSSGDVLIFPEMIRYRGLTHFDVDTFVEDVLVRGKDWVGSSKPEPLPGSYIFVCAHGSRDARCGVCGPALIQKLHEQIAARGLGGEIFVRPCSHIGGHKYAGNIIIFSKSGSGKVTGTWYGYVAPDDVALLLDQHIGKGDIIGRLWRGQMGLSEEEQKHACDAKLNHQQNVAAGLVGCESQVSGACGERDSASPCCQTLKSEEPDSEEVKDDGFPDNTNGEVLEEPESPRADACPKEVPSAPQSPQVKRWSDYFLRMPKWVQTWEREDTHAALAVIGVAALVTVAVHLHRRSASS